MSTIKLSAILVEDSIPVRFSMPASKHAELLDYLAYFNESHKSDTDLKALLPHLVAAFMAEDRSFARWRAARSVSSENAPPKIRKRSAIPAESS